MDRLHIQIGASSRALLAHIAAFDDSEGWRTDGARDIAEWVCHQFDISRWKALRWVKAAHRLRDLPRIADALETGRLCLDKVVELTRFATPDDEATLIAWARRVMVSTVRAEADAKAAEDRPTVERAENQRMLSYWWDTENDAMVLSGRLPAADGFAVASVLDDVAVTMPPHPDAEPLSEEVSIEERRADALVSLLLEKSGARKHRPAHTVVVHARLEGLLAGGEGGLIARGPALHPETLSRLCCDSRLQMVIENKNGTPIGVGFERYSPPRWMWRLVEHRDRWTCTFPGCELRRFLATHHVVPWPKGPTNIDNLILLCHFHHKLVHEYGWRVELLPTGETRWVRWDGSVLKPTDHAGLPEARTGPSP